MGNEHQRRRQLSTMAHHAAPDRPVIPGQVGNLAQQRRAQGGAPASSSEGYDMPLEGIPMVSPFFNRPVTDSGKLEYTLGFDRFGSLRRPSPCATGNCHEPSRPAVEHRDPRVTSANLREWALNDAWRWITRPELQPETMVLLTTASDATDWLMGEVRTDLFSRVLTSAEFAGTMEQRESASDALAFEWRGIETELRSRTENWYPRLLSEAVGHTPAGGEVEMRPGAILQIVAAPLKGSSVMGRWNTSATVGQAFGPWRIVQIAGEGYADVWLEFEPARGFYYHLDSIAFRNLDPFIGMVVGDVARQAAFAAMLLPLLIKGAGIALGLSGSLSMVLAGILMDELGEEGVRSAMGLAGRSPKEILDSAIGALLMDRIFHGLGKLGEAARHSVRAEAAALRNVARSEAERAFAKAEFEGGRTGAAVAGTGHHVKVTPSGWVAHCSECALLRERFAPELASDAPKAKSLSDELREIEIAAARAEAKGDQAALDAAERLGADVARRLETLRAELKLVPGPRIPLNEFDVGPIDAIEVIEVTSGRRAVPKRRYAFGEPGSESTGTFKRVGQHAGELTPAEVAHGVRLDYDPAAGRPNSVSFRVDASAAEQSAQSSRSFTQDPSVHGAQSRPRAYERSGYDRGHLVQREAVHGDPDIERSVDSMPAVVPMHPNLNRGAGSPWRASESMTIAWAERYGSVNVEVVPIYSANPARLADGTPIPSAIRRRITTLDGTVLQDATYANR